MWQVTFGAADVVARLLQDPRVRATVNMHDEKGNTALHYACMGGLSIKLLYTAASKVHLLLQAGANPTIGNKNGQTA